MSRPRINILHIIPSLAVGGAERLVADLLPALDPQRYEASLLVFFRTPADDGSQIQQLRSRGIRVFEAYADKGRLPGFLGGAWRALSAVWNISRIIRRERIDLVHCHLFGDCYGRPAAMLAGVPAISTEHNVNVSEPFVIFFIKRLTAWYLATTVAVSEAVRRDMIVRYRLRAKRACVIHNSVDLSRFPLAEKQAEGSGFRFGAVGRLDRQKGFDVLIRAMKKVTAEFPEARCIIAGEGVERARLEALIAELGLQNSVALPGIERNVPAFLSAVDCFVMPSRWEGFGIAALEAGAAACPVVASRVDGLPEIIEDGRSGMLVTPDDDTALAEAMLAMLRLERTARRAFGDALRERVVRDFSLEVMASRYAELYSRLISHS